MTRSHNMCIVSYQWCKSETTEADSHINQSREFFVDHFNGRKLNGRKDRTCICKFSWSTKLSTARKDAAAKVIIMIKDFYTFTYSKGWPFPFPSITNGCPFTLPSIRSLIFISGLIKLCGTKSGNTLDLWICNIELQLFLLCGTYHDGGRKVRYQSYSSCCSQSALFQITRVNGTSALRSAVINLNVTP